MTNTKGSGAVIAILVVVVIIIVAWLAYSQGYFEAKDKDTTSGGVEINLGGSTQ